MYSVLRSLNAAWAWRFLCFLSSDVAYIWNGFSNVPGSRRNSSILASVRLCASALGHFLARSFAPPTRATYPRCSLLRKAPPWARRGVRPRSTWPPSRALPGRCPRSPVQQQPAQSGKAPGLMMFDSRSALNRCPNETMQVVDQMKANIIHQDQKTATRCK